MMTLNSKRKILLVFSVLISVLFLWSLPSSTQAAQWITPIYQVLSNTNTGAGAIVASIWTTMMNVVNSFVLALLIYVAFMNILRIQMDSYAVKKFLPTFIMAIILANFSFLIARIIIDVANILMSVFLVGNPGQDISGAFSDLVGGAPHGPQNYDGGGSYTMYIFSYLLKQAFTIVAAVLIFILALIFLVRNYMIYFLVAIAPLGFLAMALPVTKKYFQQWWGTFTKWVFLPIVSIFWLWLAGQFLGTSNVPEFGNMWVLPTAFAAFCLYMAITTPFKVGGAVVGAWTKFGKQAWARTGGAAWNATGGAAVKAGKEYIGWQYGYGKKLAKNWAKENVRPVKYFADKGDEFAIKKDIAERKLKKYESKRRERAFYRFTTTLSPEQLKKDSLLRSRIAQFAGELRDEERGPNYREEKSLRSLAEKIRLTKDEQGQWVKASYETYRTKGPLFDITGQPIDTSGWTDEKWIEEFKTDAASTTEILRRKNNRNLDQPDWSVGDYKPSQIAAKSGLDYIDDARTMQSRSDRRPFEIIENLPEPLRPEERGRNRDQQERAQGSSAVVASKTGTSGEPIPHQYSELAGYLRDLLEEFLHLEETLKGQDFLGGEQGFDRLIGEISKMKPNLTLNDAGLAAAILPVIKVRIDSMDPNMLEQWGRKIRQVSEGVNKITNGIEAKNASILSQILAIIRDGPKPDKLKEGRSAIGDSDKNANDNNQGETND